MDRKPQKILFFDLQTLESESNSDPIKLVSLLYYHHRKKLAYSVYSKFKPSRKSLSGSSFLLNPDDLFDDKTTDILYIVQYIKLAARRNYIMYKFWNRRSLDYTFFPDLRLESIKTNPLLTITDREILFKYEEINNGISIHTN